MKEDNDNSTSGVDTAVQQRGTSTTIPTKSDSTIETHWIYFGILAAVIIVLYIFYKRMSGIMRHILDISKTLSEQNSKIVKNNQAIDTLRRRLDNRELAAEIKDMPRNQTILKKNKFAPVQSNRDINRIESVGVEDTNHSNTVTKFATLQAPDANGTLRFAERSMTDEATEQKMFEVELDLGKGTGTYRINHLAISMLMSDLQQLRDFVEPFTVSGNISTQRIINDKPGKIHQEGKFWIVDELARIKIV